MEESLINLIKKFNSQSMEDNRDKIRNDIWKEIEELRKHDEFFRKNRKRRKRFFFKYNKILRK